jgi:hypothetical protein
MGPVTFGYRGIYGVVDANGHAVAGLKEINPEEAKIVQRVFQEYVDGKSLRSIARDLTVEGIPRRRAATWTDNSASAMLKNPLYRGEVIYRRTTNIRDPLTGKISRKKVPREDWTTSIREDLRIISEDLWRAAQARRKRIAEPQQQLQKKKDFASHQRVLTDYIFCGWCGAVKHVANQGRYVCSGNRYTQTCKNSRGIKEPVARKALFGALDSAIGKLPPIRDAILKFYEADIRRKHDLDLRLIKAQEKIDRLMGAVEDGINIADAITRIKALQAEKVRLKETSSFEAVPAIPTETEIKDALQRGVDLLRGEVEREPVRAMLAVIKPRIIMTPIPDQYRGETISIELPKDPEPWARFWILLQS